MSVEPMKSRAVPRKTVRTSVNIWYKPQSRSIALSFKEFGLIATVSDKPGGIRYHPHLYNHLRSILTKQGAWPADEAK